MYIFSNNRNAYNKSESGIGKVESRTDYREQKCTESKFNRCKKVTRQDTTKNSCEKEKKINLPKLHLSKYSSIK